MAYEQGQGKRDSDSYRDSERRVSRDRERKTATVTGTAKGV
jgi:hypothetical protein